jgi:hypothetical protein
MRWQELIFIVRRLVYRRRAERELDEEIRTHLEWRSRIKVSNSLCDE